MTTGNTGVFSDIVESYMRNCYGTIRPRRIVVSPSVHSYLVNLIAIPKSYSKEPHLRVTRLLGVDLDVDQNERTFRMEDIR